MSELICAKCNTHSPEHALYCQQCGQPLVCKHCRAPLPPTARFCMECGQSIPERSNSEPSYVGIASTTPPGYNRLKIHETLDTREVDLLLSNDAVKDIRDVIPLLVDKRPSPRFTRSMGNQMQQADLVEVTPEAPPAQPQLPAASLPPLTSPEGIWAIFQEHEGKFIQEKQDLKAAHKKDYIIRLAHLYLCARHQHGEEKVPCDDVFKILDEAGVKDTRRSLYISKSGIRVDENKTFRITLDVRNRAQKYLAQALDPNLPEGWLPGTELRSANNHTKKTTKKPSEDTIVAAWVSHDTTKELIRTIPHKTIDTMTVQNKALFALYCFSKLGVATETQLSQICQYLYKAFQIQVLSTSLPGPLGKAVDKKPALATFRKGSGYRITDSGVTHIEQLLQPSK